MRCLLFVSFYLLTSFYSYANRCLFLNDTNDYVTISDSASLSLSNQFSFEAWINPAKFSLDNTYDNNCNMVLGKNRTSDLSCFNFGLFRGRPTMGCNNGAGINVAVISDFQIETNQWTHIAGTYNGTSLILYVNGEIVNVVFQTLVLQDTEFPIRLGREDVYQGRSFYGYIDEVRIWNYARTANDISTNFRKVLSGVETGLVGYWNFDDGRSSDSTLYSNNGIFNGDATTAEKTIPGFITLVQNPGYDDFMIIDLSGGPSASSYPVTYLSGVPAGGWSDTYKTSKLVLRKIPAGTFTMGSPEGELGRYSEEVQHQVTLTKTFYIGVFEVTQRQWELVMGNRPSYFNNSTYYASRPVEQVSYYDIRENPANADDPAVDWPANSAVNAASFMGKLRAKTGLSTFDLPTESQWEYACRAGTTTALNIGHNLSSESSCASMTVAGRYWYNGGSGHTQNGNTSVATAKAGSYLPNAWGLYDMHGNVWEWCLDWYGTYPGAVSDPPGAATGSYRVIRGGSWDNYAGPCRSGYRGGGGPFYRWYSFIGFRAANSVTSSGNGSTPVFSPPDGTYTNSVLVSMQYPQNTTVYYTRNSTLPTLLSSKYSGPLCFSTPGTTIIKASAYDAISGFGPVATATYTVINAGTIGLDSLYIDESQSGSQIVNKCPGDIIEISAIVKNSMGTSRRIRLELPGFSSVIEKIETVFVLRSDTYTVLTGAISGDGLFSAEWDLSGVPVEQVVLRLKLRMNIPSVCHLITGSLRAVDGSIPTTTRTTQFSIVNRVSGFIIANRVQLYREFGTVNTNSNILFGHDDGKVRDLLKKLYEISDDNAPGELDCVVYLADLYIPEMVAWDPDELYSPYDTTNKNIYSDHVRAFIKEKAATLSNGAPSSILLIGNDRQIPFYHQADEPTGDQLEAGGYSSMDPINDKDYYETDLPYGELDGSYEDAHLRAGVSRIIGADPVLMLDFIVSGIKGPARIQKCASHSMLGWDTTAANRILKNVLHMDIMNDDEVPTTLNRTEYSNDPILNNDVSNTYSQALSIIISANHGNHNFTIALNPESLLEKNPQGLIYPDIKSSRTFIALASCHAGNPRDRFDEPHLSSALIERGASGFLGSSANTTFSKYINISSEIIFNRFFDPDFDYMNSLGFIIEKARDSSIGERLRTACSYQPLFGSHQTLRKARKSWILYGIPWMVFPVFNENTFHEQTRAETLFGHALTPHQDGSIISSHTSSIKSADHSEIFRELLFTVNQFSVNYTNEYAFIDILGSDHIEMIGMPYLPLLQANEILPAGASNITLSIVQSNAVDLGELRIPSLMVDGDASSNAFTDSIVAPGTFPTSVVDIVVRRFEAYTAVKIGLCPVQFNLETHETSLLTNTVIRVSFEAPSQLILFDLNSEGSSFLPDAAINASCTIKNVSSITQPDLFPVWTISNNRGDSINCVTGSILSVSSSEPLTIAGNLLAPITNGTYFLSCELLQGVTNVAASSSIRLSVTDVAISASISDQNLAHSPRGGEQQLFLSVTNMRPNALNSWAEVSIRNEAGIEVAKMVTDEHIIDTSSNYTFISTWSSIFIKDGMYKAEFTLHDAGGIAGGPVTLSFQVSGDTDSDAISDVWEQQIVDSDLDDTITNIIDVSPDDDFDGDGLKNGEEYYFGTDPCKKDTDDDGLPDGWEVSFGLDPLNTSGPGEASEDLDGDGMSNLQEYLADTNPTNQESRLAITGIQMHPAGPQIYWQGGVWATQWLETKGNLSDTGEQWRIIFTNMPPTTTSSNTVDQGNTNPARFYRIKAGR